MLPTPDRDSAPYWEALAEGVFKVQQCLDCRKWTWPARPICSKCQSDRLEWTPVGGGGTIASWVVTHRAYTPDLVSAVPYTIALVRLDEQDDILIPGRLFGDEDAHGGMRVSARTEKVADHIGALGWVAAE